MKYYTHYISGFITLLLIQQRTIPVLTITLTFKITVTITITLTVNLIATVLII
jgi:hypothetical protein